ncbi:MAG TPA: hypothetical protein VMV86_04250 [Methanosarcinales archaeon]|nr:hypothetical protein [Methanosarcinales archaeon]
MGIMDFLISWGGTQAVIITLNKQDPEALGKQLADLVDKALDSEMGEKRSELIQDKFTPWFVRFTATFLKQLRADQNE